MGAARRMKITNKNNLPEPVYRFIATDKYSRGAADMSVTELLLSPRIRTLRARHADEIVVDASDRFWAALGTAVHEIMTTNVSGNYVSEERLFADVNGVVISGGIDLQEIDDDGVTISDYKVTSCFAASMEKPDWEAQLNAYAFLVRHAKGLAVKKIQIVAMLRDWSASSSARKGEGYPTAPVVVLPQTLWDPETQDRWVFERVSMHAAPPDALPPCTEEDMWMRPAEWAVTKIGNKRASAVLASEEAAFAWAAARGGDYGITRRPERRVRCEGNYCSVADFCDQYAAHKKEGAA